MKAKIGNVELEGTPAEIGQLLFSLGLQPRTDASTSSGEGEGDFVSEEVAFRTLKRRPLSDHQKAFFSALRKNHPDWTNAIELQKATDYTSNQLSGLLGAIGKRVGSTEGHVPGSSLLQYRWDYDNDCYEYRLPDQVKAAVERAGL